MLVKNFDCHNTFCIHWHVFKNIPFELSSKTSLKINGLLAINRYDPRRYEQVLILLDFIKSQILYSWGNGKILFMFLLNIISIFIHIRFCTLYIFLVCFHLSSTHCYLYWFCLLNVPSCLFYRGEEVKEHPFFNQVDWEQVIRHKVNSIIHYIHTSTLHTAIV